MCGEALPIIPPSDPERPLPAGLRLGTQAELKTPDLRSGGCWDRGHWDPGELSSCPAGSRLEAGGR